MRKCGNKYSELSLTHYGIETFLKAMKPIPYMITKTQILNNLTQVK